MSPKLGFPKLLGSKERISRSDLERGQTVTPPLPSWIYQDPATTAPILRNSYSAPPSDIPMQPVQCSSSPESPFDRERFGHAYDLLDGTSPECANRAYYHSPIRAGRGGPVFLRVSDQPEPTTSHPPIPWNSDDIPLLPAKVYVPPGRSREIEPGTTEEDYQYTSSMPNSTYRVMSRYPSFAYSEFEEAEHASLEFDPEAREIEDDVDRKSFVTDSVQTDLANDGRQAQAVLRHTENVGQNPELFEDMTAYERGEYEEHKDYHFSLQSSLHSHQIDPTDSFVPHEYSEFASSPAYSEPGVGDRYTTYREDDHEERGDVREYQSISSTDMSWLVANEEDAEQTGHLTSSGRHNSTSTAAATAPTIDTFIPAGSLDLDSHTDWQLSSQHKLPQGQRFSVIMSDGTSARPMSNAELANSFSSIEAMIKTGSGVDPNGSIDQSGGIMAAFTDHEPAYARENSNSCNSNGPQTDQGPGSSQTPSSPSTDCVMGDDSGRHGRLGFYEEPSPSRGEASVTPSRKPRCLTPPLQLLGLSPNLETEASVQSDGIPRPTLGRSNSRLLKAMKVNGVREDGRLAHVYPLSKADNDWETVSDIRELGTGLTGAITAKGRTGSSLADNSDSDSVPVPKQSIPLRELYLHNRVLQHPANPRENHSYVLVKDNHTGKSYSLPQSVFDTGSRVPCANATSLQSSQTRSYQHPVPFTTSHNHPFLSTPPQLSNARESPDHVSSNKVVRNYAVTPKSQSSEMSIYQLTKPTLNVADGDVSQSPRELSSKERSHFSSGWVSTISEATSALPRLPTREGSFAKISLLGNKGNVTGTPEGTGVREVGSSLADRSSPGAKFSSSPAPMASSPHIQYKSPSKAGGFQSTTSGITTPKSIRSAAPHNCFDDENDEDMPRGKEWLKYLPPRRTQHQSSITNGRHRRSSTESELITGAESSASRYYERDNTSAGLLLGQAGSYSRDHEIEPRNDQHNIRERRGNHERIIGPATPSSTQSTPIRDRNGLVYTDVPPPVFIHPVYGRNNPWDEPVVPLSPHFGRGRQMVRPQPAIRPIARAESPHLFRTTRQMEQEEYEYAKKVSFWITLAFCVLPFLAFIPCSRYGDVAIELFSRGRVQKVDPSYKRIAAFVFVLGTPLLVVAIMLAVHFQAFIT
ncbi:hypothetical protein N7G274_007929 [Stereocaulon virgatum]|uniref:Uncharacterized protein n=1 Tax=Stereocaulon virgatum TaxID=373712 RepID=A0ABR4A2W1_9LECA